MLYDNPGRGTILFTPDVIVTLSRYRQGDSSSEEAGGYLIGEQFGNQLVVQVATEPDEKNIRRRFFFKRNRNRGQKILDQLWKVSGGKMILAGEWHSHPEPFPSPSSIDIKETAKAFKKSIYPTGFMVVVIVSSVATASSWVGIQSASGLSRVSRIGHQLWSDSPKAILSY